MKRRTVVGVLALCAAGWAQPVLPPGGTVNAADYSRAIAPGALIAIFGEKLAPGVEQAAGLPLPVSLAGTSVEATDGTRTVLLPLLMVSPGQVNAQMAYDIGPAVSLRVKTAAGVSGADSFTLTPRAPRMFSWNEEGVGRAVVVHMDGEPADRGKPVKPGQWISIYANSLGAVEPPAQAGQPANDGTPGKPLQRVTAPVGVSIDGRPATVDFAGLTPGFAGLYQVNALTPFWDRIGDLVIDVTAEGVGTGQAVSIPVEPNGFYWVLSGGKFPPGHFRNGVGGSTSALVFLHDDPELWGSAGYRVWTTNTRLGPRFAASSGLALTLMSGGTIVYDNNGIEDGSHGGYYDNSAGAVPDDDKPGLYLWFSMSGNYRAIYATWFRLATAVTVDKIIGYFDGDGNPELPFDRENMYNRYRMNIWSSNFVGLPAVSSFTGNIFSTDSTPGTFTMSPTAVDRTLANGARDRIWRLVFTPDRPLVLGPGEYWFSHDVAVPETGPGGSQGRMAVSAVRAEPPGPVLGPGRR